jgi:hypothetical protein
MVLAFKDMNRFSFAGDVGFTFGLLLDFVDQRQWCSPLKM